MEDKDTAIYRIRRLHELKREIQSEIDLLNKEIDIEEDKKIHSQKGLMH